MEWNTSKNGIVVFVMKLPAVNGVKIVTKEEFVIGFTTPVTFIYTLNIWGRCQLCNGHVNIITRSYVHWV